MMKLDRVKVIAEMAKQRMTVNQVCKLSGLSRVTITNIRAGKDCNRATALAVSRAMNIPLDRLTEGEENNGKEKPKS